MNRSVYVLVLNYDGANWLERCLSSLAACSYEGAHVVLVDNASTDGSVELARRVSPGVEILQNPANLGYCQGNNAGIRYALDRGADYVALLNNDTWCEPDWIERVLEVAEAEPTIGVLGPVQLAFDGEEFNTWTTSALPHLLDSLRANDRPGIWFPVDWVEGSCLVAKRAVFDRIGHLDPIFYAFFEEIDLCRRARAAGWQVAIVPSSKIHHYRGGSFEQPAHARRGRFLTLRNSMIYASTDPASSFGSNLWGLARSNATHLKGAVRGGPENLMVWFQASGAVLVRLPALYRKWQADRRAVQC